MYVTNDESGLYLWNAKPAFNGEEFVSDECVAHPLYPDAIDVPMNTCVEVKLITK